VTRILITGAAGFLGAALAARLRADGDEIVGIDRVADPAHSVTAGDTTTPAPWARHLAGCDAILHTAAVVSNAVDLTEQWRVNVLGTQRVCAAARAGVPRIVLLSSVRAFSDTGFPDGVTEEHPVRPDGNPHLLDREGAPGARLRAGSRPRRGHAPHRGLAARRRPAEATTTTREAVGHGSVHRRAGDAR
jgi:nucleoside-diphosphate-sugar epimerase